MKTALLIVDVQIGLVELMPPALQESVLANIAALLHRARSAEVAVFFIQHDGPKGHPIEAGIPAWAFVPAILPRDLEPVIRKKASDSFFDTRLTEELQAVGVTHLIIVGAMTEYCVDTTCRRAITLGYDVTLVADAHLTRDTAVLKAAQIIAHHNLVLDGFAAGTHSIKVTPAQKLLIPNSLPW